MINERAKTATESYSKRFIPILVDPKGGVAGDGPPVSSAVDDMILIR